MKFCYKAPLLIPYGIPTQAFFSDTRRQKRQPAGEAGSLASLNEYFGNAEAGKNPKLENKMELLEVLIRSNKKNFSDELKQKSIHVIERVSDCDEGLRYLEKDLISRFKKDVELI